MRYANPLSMKRNRLNFTIAEFRASVDALQHWSWRNDCRDTFVRSLFWWYPRGAPLGSGWHGILSTVLETSQTRISSMNHQVCYLRLYYDIIVSCSWTCLLYSETILSERSTVLLWRITKCSLVCCKSIDATPKRNNSSISGTVITCDVPGRSFEKIYMRVFGILRAIISRSTGYSVI